VGHNISDLESNTEQMYCFRHISLDQGLQHTLDRAQNGSTSIILFERESGENTYESMEFQG
jgi:hypothetical protein